jgi:hypothetical protein
MTQKSHTKALAMGCTARLRRGAPMINRLQRRSPDMLPSSCSLP